MEVVLISWFVLPVLDGQAIAIKLLKQLNSVVNNTNREPAALSSSENEVTFDDNLADECISKTELLINLSHLL